MSGMTISVVSTLAGLSNFYPLDDHPDVVEDDHDDVPDHNRIVVGPDGLGDPHSPDAIREHRRRARRLVADWLVELARAPETRKGDRGEQLAALFLGLYARAEEPCDHEPPPEWCPHCGRHMRTGQSRAEKARQDREQAEVEAEMRKRHGG